MRLVFINRFFYPDESATALMLADLVQGLAPLGQDMHVITAKATYTPQAVGSSPQGMVRVTRLPNLPISNEALAGRLLNFLTFYVTVTVAGLWHIRRGDILICLTDPPLVGVVAALLAKLKGARLIHWVQDIYPETATKLGYGSPANPAIRLVSWLRDWAWKAASANVVIGERMRDMLVSRGVLPRQLSTIQNWADEIDLAPLEPGDNPLRSQWGYPNEATVVGYSGNLGRAHDAATMLEAAVLIAQRPQAGLRFLFIGGGAKHASLATAVTDERLTGMIHLRPYRPRSELRQSLSIPDIHWLSLEPELEGLIVPSKFYGAAAVGRPIIFIGDTDGEVARLIMRANCGASFARGDAKGVADYLELLAHDSELRRSLGANARNYCLAHLSKAQRIEQWRKLIEAEAIETKLMSR